MWKRLSMTLAVASLLSASHLQADQTTADGPKSQRGQTAADDEAKNAGEDSVDETKDAADAAAEGSEQATPKLWLGVGLKRIEGDLASFLGDDQGVLIDQVQSASPADKAGLKSGDVLTAVDGNPLSSPIDLMKRMKSVQPGQSLKLKVRRQSKVMDIVVVPEARPATGEIESDWAKELGQELGQELGNIGPFHLRVSPLGAEMELFRLGDPSIIRVPDDVCKALRGDLKIHVSTNIDGQAVEIDVMRKEGEKPQITIKRGDQVQTITEEDLDQLPSALSDWIGSALSQRIPKNWRQLRDLADRPELSELLEQEVTNDGIAKVESWVSELKDRFSEPIDQALKDGLSRAQEGVDLAKQLAESEEVRSHMNSLRDQIKAHVQASVDQARARQAEASASAENAKSSEGQSDESVQIAELKRMVEELRKEVAELLETKEQK